MSQRTSRFQVQFDVGGDGEVRASLKSIRDEVKTTADEVEKSGRNWEDYGKKIGTAMAFAGTAAVAGIALILRNTVEAEQELAQLGAVLRSTGQDATYSRDQLVSMAEGIAAASTFSAGEIVKAETRLLSYSGIASKNFPEALQIAIDQAARLGIGVEQSAETIGRALESPTKAAAALAQQGFGAAFTDSVRKNIKDLEDAGRTAEAQKVVIDILKESYEGAAQAQRDTFGGALKALKNTLMEVTTGRDGSLEGATAAVNDLIATLNDPAVRDGFAVITESAISSVGALASFVGWMDQAWESAQRWTTLQIGGTRQITDIKQIRYDLGELTKEQQARSQMTGFERSIRHMTGTGSVPMMSDKALRGRIAELQAMESQSVRLFGDPRVKFSDEAAMPAAMLRPGGVSGGGGGAGIGGGAGTAGRKGGGKARSAELSDEAKKAGQLEAEYGRLLKRMQEEIALTGQTTELARVNYQIKQDGLDALNPKLAEQLRLAASEIDKQQKANELKQEGARLTEEMQTPQEVLNAQLERYRELLDAGTIDQTVYDRAAADATAARDAAEDAAKRAAQTFRTTDDILADFSSRTQDVLGNDLFDAFSGNADRIQERWKQMLLSLAAELIASKVMEYFQSSGQAGASGQGGATGGGFWAGVASFFGSFFGGGRATGGSMQGGKLYEVGEHGRPELIEQNGRRFLVAGAGGNVIPAQYAAAGGAGGAGMPSIQFNVTNNHAGAEVSEPAFTWKEGKLLVDLAVNKVNQGLAQKGSPTHNSMMSGLSQGTRYG